MAFHGDAFAQFTEWAKADPKLYERLVYRVTGDALTVISCRDHY